MRKQIQQFSKYTAWLMISALAIGMILPVETTAQVKSKTTPQNKSKSTAKTKSKPTTQTKATPTTEIKSRTIPVKKVTQEQKIYWYVDFMLTINGYGEKNDENGELALSWSIDRTYSGGMKLNSSLTSIPPKIAAKGQEAIMEAVMTERFTTFQFLPTNLAMQNYMSMHVKIADALNIYRKSPGEGGSFENTLMMTSWETDKTHTAQNGLQFVTDNKLHVYNILFPFVFPNSAKLSIRSQSTIDRSENGYGGAPTHEKTPVQTSLSSLADMPIPDVEGLIERGYLVSQTRPTVVSGFNEVDVRFR